MIYKVWTNFTAFLIFVFCTCLMFTACHEPNPSSNKKVFRFNRTNGIQNTDPAFAKDQTSCWVVEQLYSGLLKLDDSLLVKPNLAQSFTISADEKTYVFTLRSDVYFPDNECFKNGKGRKLTAHDVMYSFSRLLDKKLASPGAWIFKNKLSKNSGFTVLDSFTFQISLEKPFAPLLQQLTMQYTYIVPHEAVEYYKEDFQLHPVGTGPFIMKVWDESTAMILVKNNNYHEFENGHQLPYIDGVKISFIDNKKTEFLEFKNGNLDFISGIDASYIDEVLDENGNLRHELLGEMVLVREPYLNTEYIGFQMDSSLSIENSVLIRKALNFSIDKNAIINKIRKGIGIPAWNGFTPPVLYKFYHPHQLSQKYDPQWARQLFSQAGESAKKSVVTLYTNEANKDIAEFIVKSWENLGCNAKMEIVQPALLREWMVQKKVSVFRASWIGDYADAESYLSLFYSKMPVPPNYTQFNNRDYDRLYEQSLHTKSDSVREEIYIEMEKILQNEMPVIPVYYDEVLRFVSPRVLNLGSNPMNLLHLERVQIKQ